MQGSGIRRQVSSFFMCSQRRLVGPLWDTGSWTRWALGLIQQGSSCVLIRIAFKSRTASSGDYFCTRVSDRSFTLVFLRFLFGFGFLVARSKVFNFFSEIRALSISLKDGRSGGLWESAQFLKPCFSSAYPLCTACLSIWSNSPVLHTY